MKLNKKIITTAAVGVIAVGTLNGCYNTDIEQYKEESPTEKVQRDTYDPSIGGTSAMYAPPVSRDRKEGMPPEREINDSLSEIIDELK